MTGLEKAKKKYWYDYSFDKSQNHWDAYVELNIFAEGWKQALEWAEEQVGNDYRKGYKAIKEELNATSEKRC